MSQLYKSFDDIVNGIYLEKYASLNTMANRQKIKAKAKQYRMTHKAQIQRRAKKYRKRVEMGVIVPRHRLQVGHQYIFALGSR